MNKEERAKEAAGFVTGLFTGWGVPANWARVIAGAIVGAMAAIVAMLGTGCTAVYKQTASGDIEYRGAVVIPVEGCKK